MSATSRVLEVSGRHLLISCQWRYADGPAESREIRSAAPKGSVFYELAHQGDRSLAIYTPPQDVPQSVSSGGAMVAILAPDCFVCHRLDASSFWVFAAVNGRPLPGFDRVVVSAELAPLLRESRHRGIDMRVIGDELGAQETLEDLLSTADEDLWSRTMITAGKSWKRPALLAALGGGALLATAVGYYALFVHPSTPAVQPPQSQDPAMAGPPVSPIAPVPASHPAPRLPDRVEPEDAIRMVMDALRSVPDSVNGWRPRGVTCRFPTTSCTVEWVPHNGARLDGASSIPGVQMSSDVFTSKSVRSDLNVSASAKGQVTLFSLPDLLAFFAFDSSSQTAPTPHRISISQPTASPGAAFAVARLEADLPLWMWKDVAHAISAGAVSLDQIAINQVDSNDPTLRIVAQVHAEQQAVAALGAALKK